jgi:hypothetical protein
METEANLERKIVATWTLMGCEELISAWRTVGEMRSNVSAFTGARMYWIDKRFGSNGAGCKTARAG